MCIRPNASITRYVVDIYIYSERRPTTRTTSRACHVRPVRTEIVDVRGQAERDGDH